MASKRLLYAGDGPPEGPAGYLVAILRHLKYSFTHIPPHRFMTREHLRRSYDAFILSDFPRHRMGPGAEEMLSGSVEQGAGLMMVGGWASFAGPFGGWKGSLIERQLPVTCLPGDDRVHLASGGHIFRASPSSIFKGLSFLRPPVIAGLNRVRPKMGSKVLLTVRSLIPGRDRPRYGDRQYPLMVISSDPHRRTAALTTDLAPHWCGGLVDWGRRRLSLSVCPGRSVEIGDRYLHFVSSILRWLTAKA